MPAGPIRKCRLAANSAAINRSIASTVVYGDAAVRMGNSASSTNSATIASTKLRDGRRSGSSGMPT